MKTFCIVLPEYPEKMQRAIKHFVDTGIEVDFVHGFNAKEFGLLTSHTYDTDHPNDGYHIPQKQVGCFLSHYLVWSICNTHDDEMFLVLEDDALFDNPDWESILDKVLIDLKDTKWDMLFIGSCNCMDKPMSKVFDYVYEVKYPLCTHAYIVKKDIITFLLESQRDCWASIDLALYFRSFPYLKVLTILPRIVNQFNMNLHP